MKVWALDPSQSICLTISALRNVTSFLKDSTNNCSEALCECSSRACASVLSIHCFFFCRHFEAAIRLRSRNFERRTCSGLLGSAAEPSKGPARNAFLRERLGVTVPVKSLDKVVDFFPFFGEAVWVVSPDGIC